MVTKPPKQPTAPAPKPAPQPEPSKAQVQPAKGKEPVDENARGKVVNKTEPAPKGEPINPKKDYPPDFYDREYEIAKEMEKKKPLGEQLPGILDVVGIVLGGGRGRSRRGGKPGSKPTEEPAPAKTPSPAPAPKPPPPPAPTPTEAKPAGGSDKGGYVRGSPGPCDHLRQGSGKGPYRGGAHSKTSKPANDGKDSHHMPADDTSPLPRRDGPAIQMDPKDHGNTASNGSGTESIKYRKKIEDLIKNGDWRKAMADEIKDIRGIAREAGEAGKYNEAIREMLEYFKCLENNGLLPKDKEEVTKSLDEKKSQKKPRKGKKG